MKTKRQRWEVRSSKGGKWHIYRGRQLWAVSNSVKAVAVRRAAGFCRDELRDDGRLSELFIKNKNGQIGKGSRGRRTYGRDPRGTRG